MPPDDKPLGTDGQGAFTGMDPEKLPEELKAVYNSMLTDYRTKTADISEFRKNFEGLQKQVNDLTGTIKAYETWATSLMSAGVIDQQGNVVQRTVQRHDQNTETPPALRGKDEFDVYDPRQLQAHFEKVLADREAAWTKYAQDTQKYFNDALLKMGTYVTQAARILAKDPDAPIDQIYETGMKTGGDLMKAFETVNEPIKARKALEAKNAELEKQLKETQAKLPATLGQLPGRSMPLKPLKVEKPQARVPGSMGRYHDALAKAPTDGVIVPDTALKE